MIQFKKVFFLLFCCCSTIFASKDNTTFHSIVNSEHISEPDQVMSEIVDKSVKEITKIYNFETIGVGMSGKFRGVGISFQMNSPLNKTEARKALMDCAEILLNSINNSEKIQPYLETKPFKIENIGITIYSTDDNHHSFPHPSIAVAKIGFCGLLFRTEEPGQTSGYKEVTKETIEEARAILNKTSAQ